MDLLLDGVYKYLHPVDYTCSWSVSHHIRFLIMANTIKKHNCATVLDVGCGELALVEYLKKLDWVGLYHGIDKNQKYIDTYIKTVTKSSTDFIINVFNTEIENAPNTTYDAVVLGEVIEHFDNKEEASNFLDKAISKMHKDSIMILTTPNAIDGKINWPDDHKYEFSYAELVNLFTSKNLQILFDCGLWKNTKETKEMLSEDNKKTYEIMEKFIPNSILNINFNLPFPEKTKAILFVLKKK